MPKLKIRPPAKEIPKSKKPPVKASKSPWPDFTKKFGNRVRRAGITAVPKVFITGIAKLKIKPIHVVVLLQMLACWGKKGPHPFPKRRTMMRAIGCDKRTLDRAINYMVQKGLIEKHPRFQSGRQTTNEYRLVGLVERLKPLAVVQLEERERRRQREAEAD
jgi:DNA-binding HxlR family transcriptional regulator